MGLSVQPLDITIDSDIPTSGGLGSSAACVVAGILLAQTVEGLPIDIQLSLDVATEIEGHPDNVAPALLGGLVSTFVTDERAYSTRYDVGECLRFVVCAPQYEVRTHEARQVLPESFSLGDVVWQMGRCVAAVHALSSGDAELFGASCDDRLHEPYRKGLIKDYELLRSCALNAGADAFFISGSGSAMVALAASDVQARKVEEALRKSCPDMWIQSLPASLRGAYIHEG
ncbi:MAG: homoserine kinase [Atopobiaceae bacterium]|nr:homoserine kinase [Atopobiaceae bacterium]